MTYAPASLNIPKEPDDRRVWIWVQLSRRGTSLSRLAEEIGKSRQSLSHALGNPSEELEAVIAHALGLTAQQLFPERFTSDGIRIPRSRSKNRTTKRFIQNVKNEEAA